MIQLIQMRAKERKALENLIDAENLGSQILVKFIQIKSTLRLPRGGHVQTYWLGTEARTGPTGTAV